MTPPPSAGILLYRLTHGSKEFFLLHPGGPFFANSDLGVWSIPKGQIDPGEPIESAARREFFEETGVAIKVPLLPLPPVILKSKKIIHAFTAELDIDPAVCRSNLFELDGHWYPEADNFAWFSYRAALRKIHPGQAELVRLVYSM